MNKQQLFDALGGVVSKTAIVNRDGRYAVRGKYAIVTPNEAPDSFDVWVCNPADIAAGLGTRAVRFRMAAIREKARLIGPYGRQLDSDESEPESACVELDGEAYFPSVPAAVVTACLTELGIRRKRTVSPETIQKAAERLAKARAA
jgi:hypothetical protein